MQASKVTRCALRACFNTIHLGGVVLITKPTIFGQLGSILEAQDPPKSRPKPQKIDVENQYVFGIDF